MEESTSSKKHRGRKIVSTIVLVLLVSTVGLCAFFYVQYHNALKNNPNAERDRIVTSIGKVIELPDEQPVFSTVQNNAKLANPTLRQRAKNGDKLLIYAVAKRLIIYRPSTHKVVDLLTIQSTPSSGTGQ